MGKIGTEKDVADLILFLCSNNSSYLSGECINLDGAATIQEQFSLLTRFYKTIKK